jgi:hypothetical protein
VAALLLVVAAGLGIVYLRFPEVLPEWARAPKLPESSDGAKAGSGGTPATSKGPLPPPGTGASSATQSGTATAGTPGTSLPPQPGATPAAARPVPTVPPGARQLPGSAAIDPASLIPRGNAPAARFSSVEEIWGQHSGPGTLVTIVTNGAVPPDAYSHFRLEGASPREVIRLRGVDDSFKRSSIPVATGEVKQVRLGYHAEGAVTAVRAPAVSETVSSTPATR